MGIFGVVDAAASSALGKLSDTVGRLPLLVFGSVLHLVGYILLIAIPSVNNIIVLIIVACILGIGDAAFNTQIYGVLGYMFADSSEASFASYKFYRAASTGTLFFSMPHNHLSLTFFPLPFLPYTINFFLLFFSSCSFKLHEE